MKKILFLLFAFASLYSVAQVPDTSRAKKVYGNMIWVKYDTTAATWDTLGIFPGATPEIWSSSGLNPTFIDTGYVKTTGDTLYGTYLLKSNTAASMTFDSNYGRWYGSDGIETNTIMAGNYFGVERLGGGGNIICSLFRNYLRFSDSNLGLDTYYKADSIQTYSYFVFDMTTAEFTGDLIVNGTNGIQVGRATATTYDHRLIYNMLSSKTVANTTTPTSLFNDTSAIGTRTIPANFLRAGTTIRLHMRGDISNTGNPTNTMSITLGGTTISSTTATLGVALTNSICEIEMDIVVRSIGTNGKVVAAGYAYVVSGITRSLLATTPITINTESDLALDVVYTWGAANAANTLTMLTGSIEILY